MILVYTEQLPPFIMVPFSVGLGPQRGCQIAPPIKYLNLVVFSYNYNYNIIIPCKYISSPSPNGSPHLAHLAHVGWKWWLSPALNNFDIDITQNRK